MAKTIVVLKPLHKRCAADGGYFQELGECDDPTHKNRVFEADLVKMMDDKTLLMGFEPTQQVRIVNGFGTNRARKYKDKIANKTNNPEFWSIQKLVQPGGKPQFRITEKFKTVLTANINNIISIDGKAPFNISNASSQHLDIDESWSVNNISRLLEE